MANPTTNYGFVLPTPTDLVTDLPADFDVALQGVDTQLKALQPGTTLGDLAYSSATANTNTRLPIGTTGQVLAVSGGIPAWTTTADVTPLTTKGDLFTFTTVDARIGIGANNTILTADSAQATGLKWAVPASPTAVACSVYNAGGSVTYVANVPQILNFTNENFDTNTMHDNSTNTSRITIPAGYAGKYLVNGTMRSASGVGYVLIRVYQNGAAVTNGLESGELVRGYYAANSPGINGSVVLNLAVNDYIEIGVQTDTAGALTTYSRFSVSYLGA